VLIGVSQSEERANIKFFCKLGKSGAETPVDLNAVYGDKFQISAVYFGFFTHHFTKNYG
jgi:hypothetical protein